MSSGQTLVDLPPCSNEPPTASAALADTRNARPVIAFPSTSSTSAVFTATLPRSYAGGGLTVAVWWCAASATSGNVNWQGAFERNQAGTDSVATDSFAAAQSSGATATPGTAGVEASTPITFTAGAQMDSTAAGEVIRFKLTRDTTVASNFTGDAQVFRVEIRET